MAPPRWHSRAGLSVTQPLETGGCRRTAAPALLPEPATGKGEALPRETAGQALGACLSLERVPGSVATKRPGPGLRHPRVHAAASVRLGRARLGAGAVGRVVGDGGRADAGQTATPKVAFLLFRLGCCHPGRRPRLRGGGESRGVPSLRRPLLPHLPGEHRPAFRGALRPPSPRPPWGTPRHAGRRRRVASA